MYLINKESFKVCIDGKIIESGESFEGSADLLQKYSYFQETKKQTKNIKGKKTEK